jgi:hypothetical protein
MIWSESSLNYRGSFSIFQNNDQHGVNKHIPLQQDRPRRHQASGRYHRSPWTNHQSCHEEGRQRRQWQLRLSKWRGGNTNHLTGASCFHTKTWPRSESKYPLSLHPDAVWARNREGLSKKNREGQCRNSQIGRVLRRLGSVPGVSPARARPRALVREPRRGPHVTSPRAQRRSVSELNEAAVHQRSGFVAESRGFNPSGCQHC